MQRSAVVAGGEFAIGLARLPARLVRHHEDEGVQPLVVRPDPLQALLGDLFRRQLARAQPAAEFDDRERVDQCVHENGRVNVTFELSAKRHR